MLIVVYPVGSPVCPGGCNYFGRGCFVDGAKDVAKIAPRTQPGGNAVDIC